MKETTIGEQRVRLAFNPSDDSLVYMFKSKIAELINICDEHKNLDPRLAAVAMTTLEEAAMWCVKLVTSPGSQANPVGQNPGNTLQGPPPSAQPSSNGPSGATPN